MTRNIHSLAHLKLEIERLSSEKQLKEKQLNSYVKEYAESLKPINLIKNIFSSVTGDSELKSMLKSKSTEAVIGFVVTQLIFKNANPLVRTAATVLGTTFASSIFGDDSPQYIEKIKKLFHKFKTKKVASDLEKFNEADIYSG